MNSSSVIRARTIAEYLGRLLAGPDIEVTHPASIGSATDGALVWLRGGSDHWLAMVRSRPDLFVIADESYEGLIEGPHVLTDRPRYDFARALAQFFGEPAPIGIDPSARVSATAKIGTGVGIGPGAVIEDGVEIGDDTVIGPLVVIRRRAKIGPRCLLKASCTVGDLGFGFGFDPRGAPVRIPHLGTVQVGADVEIGSHSTVMRGTLDDTIVGDGVKIDDNVTVAHNVRVGRFTVITAGAILAGSCKVGERCWIGPGAVILDGGLTVGDDSQVGPAAMVAKDVPPCSVMLGNPARQIRVRQPDDPWSSR